MPMSISIRRARAVLVALALVVVAAGAATAWLARGRWFATAIAETADVWTCSMHPEVREPKPGRCPKCGMALVPAAKLEDHSSHTPPPTPTSGAPETGRADLTLDTRRQQLIGVRTARAERTRLARSVRTVGFVRYDERRLADVNLKVDGWVRDLEIDFTGQHVRRGQTLFTLYSPELLTTQHEYLLALRTRDQLAASQVPEAREHAERLVAAARQRLALWDMPDAEVRALDERREARTAIPFLSPVSGYVIEKQVVQGMRVMAGQTLYRVADLSVVWIEADLHESEMPFVKVGAAARVTLDAYPGRPLDGRVTYTSPFVAEQTRTVKVRLELANRTGRLRPGMYANVEVHADLGAGLTVPADAVLDTGAEQVVFVAQGGGYFEPRRVAAGYQIDGRRQILRGLDAGEEVASAAAFFLDSESQLRAALQGYQPPAPQHEAAGAQAVFQIAFRSDPDPPRAGENVFEVSVRDASGRPVTDAGVTVLFYMAPMPSMNMPAMRSETRLGHIEDGVYRAPGTVLMSGRWDVIVTVSRGGERLGTKQLSVTAK